MATVDWPSSTAFRPAQLSLSVDVKEAVWVGFYTGAVQRRSNLADRWILTVTLAPCLAVDGAAREAFLMGTRSRGDLIRMGLAHRIAPAGTARGTIVVNGAHTAGSRTLAVTGISPSTGTLLPGDMLQIGTNVLLQVAYPGVTASGGAATIPLTLPLPIALSNGAGVTWSMPKGLWQIDDGGLQMDYTAPVVQGGFALQLRQVVT